MTIQRQFYDWQRNGSPLRLPPRCSPALVQALSALERRWNCSSLGCRDPAATSDSGGISTHRWAAIDVSYNVAGELQAREEIIPYLVAWSSEWGLQAIHHYNGKRIWRAGRTPDESEACTRWWKVQRTSSSGMGASWASWLHLEVHPDAWFDARTEAARGIR